MKKIWLFWIIVIFLVLFLILYLSRFIYIVSENNYSISDGTGEIELKNYPEIKEIKFMYNSNLLIKFIEPINLELEKIDLLLNNKIVGTIEINININDLENFSEPYIDKNTQEKVIRKIYPLQKEFLRILGKNAEIYDSLENGIFYIDIYIKDLKTNKTFIINRNKISIYYESAGIKTISM